MTKPSLSKAIPSSWMHGQHLALGKAWRDKSWEGLGENVGMRDFQHVMGKMGNQAVPRWFFLPRNRTSYRLLEKTFCQPQPAEVMQLQELEGLYLQPWDCRSMCGPGSYFPSPHT